MVKKYRVKTESEFINELGINWRQKVSNGYNSSANSLFGYVLTEKQNHELHKQTYIVLYASIGVVDGFFKFELDKLIEISINEYLNRLTTLFVCRYNNILVSMGYDMAFNETHSILRVLKVPTTDKELKELYHTLEVLKTIDGYNVVINDNINKWLTKYRL